MPDDLKEACRAYSEALWRNHVLGDDSTASDEESALERLKTACEDAFPMPDNMKQY